MMRVAIDLQALRGARTGHRVYLEGLLEGVKALGQEAPELVRIDRVGEELNTLYRVLWDQIGLPLELRGVSADLLFVPAFSVPFLSPLPVVATIHDLTSLRYPPPSLSSRLYWVGLLPASLKRARFLIAISNWTKQQALAHLHIPEERMRVIYSGVSERFRIAPSAVYREEIVKRYELPQQFIMVVGTIEPKRNHAVVLKAYRALTNPPALVFVGKKGSAWRAVTGEIRQLNVRVIEGANERELHALYYLARLLVIPSLDEGFGLPAVEAMASGIPVLASRSGALPEVLLDAAEYFEPRNVEELAHKLTVLLHDSSLREELVRRGLARSKFFSWKRCAHETVAVWKEAMAL